MIIDLSILEIKITVHYFKKHFKKKRKIMLTD